MKNTIIILSLIAFLSSCGTNDSQSLTNEETAILDTIQSNFNCQISVATTRDLLRFRKPYDFEIKLLNTNVNNDSLDIYAQYVAEKFYPYLNNKDKFQNLIVTFESKSEGNAGTGNDVSYTFNLEE